MPLQSVLSFTAESGNSKCFKTNYTIQVKKTYIGPHENMTMLKCAVVVKVPLFPWQ